MTLGGKVSDRGSVGTDSDGKWRVKIYFALYIPTLRIDGAFILGVFQTAFQRSQRGRKRVERNFFLSRATFQGIIGRAFKGSFRFLSHVR